jgi:hypothetical protein
MIPRQIEIVQNSFNLVVPTLESAAMAFYDRLFQLDPSLRRMFHGPQAEHTSKPAPRNRKGDWVLRQRTRDRDPVVELECSRSTRQR